MLFLPFPMPLLLVVMQYGLDQQLEAYVKIFIINVVLKMQLKQLKKVRAQIQTILEITL
nr:MAG TPA: PLK4, STIL-box, Complex, transferase.6A [Bacteriophage sp.]